MLHLGVRDSHLFLVGLETGFNGAVLLGLRRLGCVLIMLGNGILRWIERGQLDLLRVVQMLTG